jgi:hypothetical protein
MDLAEPLALQMIVKASGIFKHHLLDSTIKAGGHCHNKYILMRTERRSNKWCQTVGTVFDMA